MPLITIITVVYNGEAVLENTIKSVLALSHLNINYIIIDGKSTDNTVSIIRKYESKIYKWLTEPDKGIYDAMNKGWSIANKDSYILFLGAGDEIYSLPENLAPDYSKVYYGDVYIGKKLFKSTHNFKLKLGSTIHHQALLIPKALHEKPPFEISYKLYADFDLNQRLLKQKVEFEYCKEFVAFALPGGISANRSNNEMLSIVKKNFGLTMSYAAAMYYRLQKLKRALT
jgi:glycosyltransferase involved in cell wall biosynthesis